MMIYSSKIYIIKIFNSYFNLVEMENLYKSNKIIIKLDTILTNLFHRIKMSWYFRKKEVFLKDLFVICYNQIDLVVEKTIYNCITIEN